MGETKTEESFASALSDTNAKVSSSLRDAIDNHVNNDEYDAERDGLDFLEVKNSLMLSYLIDLTQMIRIRSRLTSGDSRSPDASACLRRLNEMRVVLDKIRPMEKRMRYQIDKLLALSTSVAGTFAAGDGVTPREDSGEAGEGTRDDAVESDPLSFRPDPEAMMRKDEDENDESDEEPAVDEDISVDGASEDEEDDDLKAAKVAVARAKASKKGKGKKIGDEDGDDSDEEPSGVYRAPRLAAVPFQEREKQEEKEERMRKRMQERMRKSELAATLRAEFGDRPEEDDLDGGANLGRQKEAARRAAELDAERVRFEEEAFVRLAASRKDKKERKRLMREEASNLTAISDLGSLAAGVSAAFGNSGKDDSDDDLMRGSGSIGRYSNGKRKRADEFADAPDKTRKGGRGKRGGSNSFQKALYGTEGGGKKKKMTKR